MYAMKTFNKFYIAGILLIFLSSCSSVKTVAPMKKGEKKATVDLGGPLIKFSGIPIFIPLSSIGFGYGITDNLSFYTSLHTTSLLYRTLQVETSANFSLAKFSRSGLTMNLGSYTFMGFKEARWSFYPITDFNFYLHYSSKEHYLYYTFTSMFELHARKAFDKPVEHKFIPNLTIGHRWVKERYQWGIELKYLYFNKDNRNIVVNYISPSNTGSLGLYFSFAKNF